MTAATQPAPAATARPEPLPDAKAPVGPGVITAVGVVLALVVLCLGVVGAHDALIPSGLVTGPAWIGSALTASDGLTPATWTAPTGLLLLAAGVWALVIALRPRPRTAIVLKARTGVYLRPRDVARLARTAADDVDGVISAKASASRRTVTVSVRATSTEQITEQVARAVDQALGALAGQPKVRVRVTSEAGAR